MVSPRRDTTRQAARRPEGHRGGGWTRYGDPRVVFRCPPGLIERLDACAAARGETRSDLLRAVVARAVGELERRRDTPGAAAGEEG